MSFVTSILQSSYHPDSLSHLFAIAVGLLFVVTPLILGAGPTRSRDFWPALLLVVLAAAGLLSLVYTSNLLLVYLSWEIIGILGLLVWPRARLIPVRENLKSWLLFNASGYPFLAGVLLLQTRAGTFDYTSSAAVAAFSGIVFLLFFATVAIRLALALSRSEPDGPLFPLAVSREVLVFSLPGTYLLTRTYSLGRWEVNWSLLIIAVASVILIGAVVRLFSVRGVGDAFSWFALTQVSFVVLATGLGTASGAAAGLLYLLVFALTFTVLLGGSDRLALPEWEAEHGDAAHPSLFPTSALAIGLALAGLPFLGSFVGQWLFYSAALDGGYPIIAVVGGTATLCAGLLLCRVCGLAPGSVVRSRSWTWLVISPIATLVLLVLGAVPQLPLTYLIKPAVAALAPGLTELRVVEIRPWLGLEINRGNGLWGLWLASPALIVFILALIVGYVIYRFGRPSGEPADVFTGGEVDPPNAARS